MIQQATPPTPKARLGLTGLTSNAMAMIAPGAFLWLTYSSQSAYGAPNAAISMWFGVAVALALCLATAVCYAQLSRLYAGAGSSYFFAEQALLSTKGAYRLARIARFTVGWTSHLYYWVYPGVMAGVAALVAGYVIGQVFPNTFRSEIPSLLFMVIVCVVSCIGVSYIAFRGIVGMTAVNAVINVVQIIALIIFSVMAIGYRVNHAPRPGGPPVPGWALASDGLAYPKAQAIVPDPARQIDDPTHPGRRIQDPDAFIPAVKDDGTPIFTKDDVTVSNDPVGAIVVTPGSPGANVSTFQYHPSARSVVAPHRFSFVIIQTCIAMLLLVGFESITTLGEEARDARRRIPRAIILSLLIQGGFCYLLEYFAANYFLHNNYTSTTAAGAIAPVGDMMQIIGASFFNSTRGGWWSMMAMAATVLLAVVGTTLSCISAGARINYAMGRDDEIPRLFGKLHGKNGTPHHSIWALAAVSAVVGIFAVLFCFCGPAAGSLPDTTIDSLSHDNFWYHFGLFKTATAARIPNSLLIVTLVCNFGSMLLYMMTSVVTVVAFSGRRDQSLIKHLIAPLLGLLANLLCMTFYLAAPFMVMGMSKAEPYIALTIAFLWGACGLAFFLARSVMTGKPLLVAPPPQGERWHAGPIRPPVPNATTVLRADMKVRQRPLFAEGVAPPPLPGIFKRCLTERCRLPLRPGARFCPRCGRSTVA